MTNTEIRKVTLVLFMGLMGGLVSYLLPTEAQPDWPWKEIFLGMAASFLGVYITDLHEKLSLVRILALALACGIFWKPVIEGSGDWLDKVRVQAKVTNVQSEVQDLIEQAGSNAKLEPEKLIKTTDAVIEAAQSVASLPSTTAALTTGEELRKLNSLLEQFQADSQQDAGFKAIAEQQQDRLTAVQLTLPASAAPLAGSQPQQ